MLKLKSTEKMRYQSILHATPSPIAREFLTGEWYTCWRSSVISNPFLSKLFWVKWHLPNTQCWLSRWGDQRENSVCVSQILLRAGVWIRSLFIAFLTFRAPALPVIIKDGYGKARLQPHIPNPMYCFHCQALEYTNQWCISTIVRCSKGGHGEALCPSTLYSVNCNQICPFSENSCPICLDEKFVEELKSEVKLLIGDTEQIPCVITFELALKPVRCGGTQSARHTRMR